MSQRQACEGGLYLLAGKARGGHKVVTPGVAPVVPDLADEAPHALRQQRGQRPVVVGGAVTQHAVAVLPGNRLLEVRGEDVPGARRHVLLDGHPRDERAVAHVAKVGIDAQVGAVDHPDVAHGLGHLVHEERLHGLEAQRNARPRRHLDRRRQRLREQLARMLGALLIVDVIAGNLDDAQPQVARELEGGAEDAQAALAHGRVGVAQREAPQRREAHRLHAHARFGHGAQQVEALVKRPVEPHEALVGLVYRDLEVVEAGLAGGRQPLAPREGGWQRLLVESQHVVVHVDLPEKCAVA